MVDARGTFLSCYHEHSVTQHCFTLTLLEGMTLASQESSYKLGKVALGNEATNNPPIINQVYPDASNKPYVERDALSSMVFVEILINS